jgi:fatty acid amide hydrolase 2
VARKNHKAKEDAECVKLMKEAGAIIIATSNIPEVNRWYVFQFFRFSNVIDFFLIFRQESRNYVVGQTNNPYDSRRTVGGSSGGEAALIASAASAFGLGLKLVFLNR